MYLFRQAGRNHWQLRWWQGGRRHECSTGTSDRLVAERILLSLREAAERRAPAARVAALLTAVFATEAPAAPSLDATASLFLDATNRNQYARQCYGHWRRFAAWVAGHRPGVVTLADVDPASCRAFAASLTGAPKTQAIIMADCARVFRAVAPAHGISADPWRGIRMPSGRVREVRAFTPVEVERMLAVATGEYRGAILVALYTGLRYRDVAHLAWEQVQGDALVLAPHKTGRHGIRVAIPLHQTLRAYLAGLRRSGPLVFPELARTYSARCTARRFGYVRRDTGLPAEATFHWLRHTVATRLKEAGVPEDVRRRILGHTQAATHDGYVHGLAQERAAIALLPTCTPTAPEEGAPAT